MNRLQIITNGSYNARATEEAQSHRDADDPSFGRRNAQHNHRWIVEPAERTGRTVTGALDGELYTRDMRRGNLIGECRVPKCAAVRIFHPNASAVAALER